MKPSDVTAQTFAARRAECLVLIEDCLQRGVDEADQLFLRQLKEKLERRELPSVRQTIRLNSIFLDARKAKPGRAAE